MIPHLYRILQFDLTLDCSLFIIDDTYTGTSTVVDMKRINIYVPEDDYDWMKKVAKRHDQKISVVIRRAIRHYKLLEGQVLGEAFVPTQPVSDDAIPSKEECTQKGMQQRLEKLEKFVFGKVITTPDIEEYGYLISQGYLPDYLKE